MPRSSGRSSGGRSAGPSRSSGQQSRGAHTMAAPAGYNAGAPPHSQAAQPKQPGMIAQMAATAGSVAVGSTIGHGLSNMLFGSSSHAPVEQQQEHYGNSQQYAQPASCEIQAKDFTKCLDVADMQSCSWYLEQLKACQAASKQFN